ncbi:hypothetical protein BDA96_02G190800 [Sorghum bicolor]|jgi:hypothetical protein|uniref:DUF4283 domain-containing protein n=2 Tax=Sorghum bicolor TaxID=4558 RepID=A0A921UTC1_SORBI|nr:hypothetical protein BDA96_02G190800 [Sorghum bicolor]OQU89363.1 hypothetical protein SORBI_3002G180732 [Sorghum bicolor]
MDSGQDQVLNLMGKMNLSESEKAPVRIGGRSGLASSRGVPQVVAKVLTEHPIRAEVVEATLGKIWCPIKGVECNDLGGNRFLISFMQGSGKKRALDARSIICVREARDLFL